MQPVFSKRGTRKSKMAGRLQVGRWNRCPVCGCHRWPWNFMGDEGRQTSLWAEASAVICCWIFCIVSIPQSHPKTRWHEMQLSLKSRRWSSLLWTLLWEVMWSVFLLRFYSVSFFSLFLTPPCCFSLGPDPTLKCVSFFSSSPHQVLYHAPSCSHKTHHSPSACGTKHCAPHRAQPCHALCSLRHDDWAYRNPQLYILDSLNWSSLSPGCYRIPSTTTSRQTCCHCARDNFSRCICPHQPIQTCGSCSLAHWRASHCPGAMEY